MKFFIPISSFASAHWASRCDAPNTPAPSGRLCYPYSKRRNLQPRSGGPNTAYPKPETPAEDDERCDLSTSSQTCSYSTRVDTLHEGGRALYSLHPSICGYSRYRISERLCHDRATEHHLSKHGNDISLPKLYESLTNLPYENHDDIIPYGKVNMFIQTKVTAINCGDLTYC